ncbi:2-C-methyl-D-erythritol 2,4-cyclodiphosphate synthase [Candidatus Neptunochlamydia vexilliferae]|uniref:2-C-methyl-D-erythritol 2,4-cyclodiphosphate synthase n=1 Tax=Candidatus Neptunichlamydia vexilliferae TaxID=1651774 RepID=A0ABS0AXM8_9BACT|nr:2-C-methyl-D-erythritol 2,4-cyclodiphosphate synthase [Candidatus Neptunochlamydia vexilliferae]MBF5058719.1 2-C-methyl-D-erythritol 2,4-cyclodiphosphate synthase [Candidatus Neptunochlamydia vexilliferae]
MKTKTGIGQDSHRFLPEGSKKKCIVAGLPFEDAPGLDADSDGDVVFHAICNAITSITHVPILGKVAIDLCRKEGITDSRVYLEKAAETLGDQTIEHIALTIEGGRPKFQKRAEEMRKSVADLLSLSVEQVGITFTSGDRLTAFGRGEGLMCFCVATIASS